MALCVGVYFLYAGLTVVLSLRSSAANLDEALAQLRAGRVAESADSLRDAWVRAHIARTAAADPVMRLIGGLGPLEDDLAVVDALADASAGTAEAALGFLDDAGNLATPGALYEDGRLRMAGVGTLADALHDASLDIEAVAAALDGAPVATLRPLRDALFRTRERFANALRSIGRAEIVLGALPTLAGADGERRYLLAFQSPSEARAAGGLFGMYGIVSADDGRFELLSTGSVEGLNSRLSGEAVSGGWFSSAYGSLGAFSDLRQTGLSPTFPSVGDAWLEMFESATGERLDGVIAMDPIVLGKLTRATGPIEAAGWSVSINAANARRLMLRDTYTHFGRWGERAQTRYLRDLVNVLWSRLSSGDVKVGALATALGQAVETRHLKIYVRDPDAARALRLAGADGDPRAAGANVQMLFHNNWSASKVDFLLQRELATEILVRSDGSAEVTTTTTLFNRAEARDTPLTRSGIRRTLPAGHNQMTLGILLPKGANLVAVETPAGPIETATKNEGGRPLVSLDLGIGAGRATEVVFIYDIANFVVDDSVRFTLYPQATVRPDAFTLTIHPPDGYRFGDAASESFTRSGLIKAPKTVTASLVLN